MRNLLPISLAVLCISLSVGCGSGSSSSDKKIVASVNGIHLYEEEVLPLVPAGLTKEDSILFINRYVQNWAEEQLLVQEAEKDAKINKEEIENRVEEYRRTLIYYEHVENLVASGMDTAVTEAQLKEFYESNKANFELKDNILKAIYVIAPSSAKKAEKAKKRFFATGEKDEVLADFCRDAAYRCQLDDTSWISYDNFAKVIPIDRTQSPDVFLKKKSFEINDTGLVYWVKINDYKIKESVSPFEFVRDEIKLILLNRRKKDFLVAYRKKLFDEALENKNVELHYP